MNIIIIKVTWKNLVMVMVEIIMHTQKHYLLMMMMTLKKRRAKIILSNL